MPASRRMPAMLLALLLVICVTLLAAAPAALAAEPRAGQSVVVAKDEVVNDDVYAFGNSVVVDGRINGDLVAAGQSVLINGEVTGSVWAAAQSVTVNGRVGGSVRIAGQYGTVTGSTARDLLFAGQGLTVSQGATVGTDVLVAGAAADLLGSVGRNVRASAGQLNLGGPVKGSVEATAETLTLAPGANIAGNLTYTSANDAHVAAGAVVAGQTVHNQPPPRQREPGESLGRRIVGWIIGLLMAFIVGLAVIVLAPRLSEAAADAILSHPWTSLGWGALILFAGPVAILLVAVTLIGIPLALIAVALYAIAVYIAQVFVSLFIGRWLLSLLAARSYRFASGRDALTVDLIIGLVILAVLREIPFVGGLITLAVVLWGLGALVLAIQQRWTPGARPQPVPAT